MQFFKYLIHSFEMIITFSFDLIRKIFEILIIIMETVFYIDKLQVVDIAFRFVIIAKFSQSLMIKCTFYLHFEFAIFMAITRKNNLLNQLILFKH